MKTISQAHKPALSVTPDPNSTEASQDQLMTIRPAILADVAALLQLENQAFNCDRLNRRSFRHAITSSASELIIAETHTAGNDNGTSALLGYALMHLRHGTSLTRLYSIAVANQARNLGVGQALIHNCEDIAISRGRRILRLEVSDANSQAIGLYKKLGYRVFGQYNDYYEDHSNAIRMQKRLHGAAPAHTSRLVPWVAQGTPFTCGPASLQMALRALQPDYPVTPEDELDIWREATTIFMTSGHGGCHPM